MAMDDEYRRSPTGRTQWKDTGLTVGFVRRRCWVVSDPDGWQMWITNLAKQDATRSGEQISMFAG